MPQPYWSDGKITIYHGDALDIVPQLATVELVLTDPPYGIKHESLTTQTRKTSSVEKRRRTGRGGQGRINTWHAESDWDKQLVLPEFAAEPLIGWFGNWRMQD